MKNGKPSKNVVVQWRLKRHKLSFAPPSDCEWTEFVTLLGNPRTKEGPVGEAKNIINACNQYWPEGPQVFEFRLHPKHKEDK